MLTEFEFAGGNSVLGAKKKGKKKTHNETHTQ